MSNNKFLENTEVKMQSQSTIEKDAVQKHFPLTTVGALVVNSRGDVLIVKTTKWRGTWGVPGGKVDWGETLEAALIREFREEVGLDLSDIRFGFLQEAVLDSQFYKSAHFIMVNYYAFSASETIIPNEEIVEWAWVTPQQAQKYPLNTYTQVLIEDYLQNNISKYYHQ
ncbi:NUDIX domain-containing protein [Anabaenopsis sp. FSS-46]|uniref:NUDIX domain-containing protein n=1 Tax=Anabaenopsis sp. FSS-46 TaxID=2971766 RepID=UPI002474261E|nr:NUDIX domain-containing protein [Anabaenopsis sp. FSS-46]MDH6100802.1 NUDIX domain-containing protein [Anabaenopsis sp. FSS-46]